MKPICIVEGCERSAYGLNLCNAHYQQFYLYGKILPRPIRQIKHHRGAQCSVEGCSRAATDLGYCNAHYLRKRNYGDLMAHKPIRVTQRRSAA